MYKNIRLTPYVRQEIWRLYTQENYRVIDLAKQFQVSRPTVHNVLKKSRLQEFTPRPSTNNRIKQPRYGLKRLAKVEKRIQERLKREAKRYNIMWTPLIRQFLMILKCRNHDLILQTRF